MVRRRAVKRGSAAMCVIYKYEAAAGRPRFVFPSGKACKNWEGATHAHRQQAHRVRACEPSL